MRGVPAQDWFAPGQEMASAVDQQVAAGNAEALQVKQRELNGRDKAAPGDHNSQAH